MFATPVVTPGGPDAAFELTGGVTAGYLGKDSPYRYAMEFR